MQRSAEPWQRLACTGDAVRASDLQRATSYLIETVADKGVASLELTFMQIEGKW